jgi:hypothetical protein
MSRGYYQAKNPSKHSERYSCKSSNTPNKTLTLSIGGQMRAPSGNMDGHVKTGPKMSATETIIAMSAAALSGASNLVMMPNTSYEG